MSAFPTSAVLNLPIVDADTMGRAYPTLYHSEETLCHCTLVHKLIDHAESYLQHIRISFRSCCVD